ncbi:hypothetical protein IW140_004820 [Coemansia sp. RSA 1813]|nr:hypothetical protein EV178_004849 [Coemansia sp. RSA 1646]KAJ1766983.1 hypothetical protein LPJ74_005610 [Coemansia sp. RSA 1843]KAJ2088820.1 hypothetical protein IW138_003892 [Coemansia sp. RSA 986]KAJ2212350.1 hypothetical protein EV179_004745 [Coemansia sp. RSA 487]KAJ2566697.1 hypothetical protein IW140_004820 [Coemansia sp. RSA 1813]
MFGIVSKQKSVMLNSSAMLLARTQAGAAAIRHSSSNGAYTTAATATAMVVRSTFQQRMGMHTTTVAAVKKTPSAENSGEMQTTTAAAAQVTPTVKVPRIDPSLPGLTLTAWQKVKAYGKFYVAGFTQLRQNGQTVKAVRARMRAGGKNMSREELQVQVRHTMDKKRLVPFALIVLVCMELSPLVFLAVPSLCPSTCVTYGQAMGVAKKHDSVKLRIHAAALERIRSLGLEAADFASSETLAALAETHTGAKLFALKDLARADLQLVNQFMGVTGRISTPISAASGLRRRLLKHLEYLQHDDRLLSEEGLLGQLPLTELHSACQERGIPSADYGAEDLKKALLSWTTLSNKCRSAEDMLPIVWSRLVLFNKAIGV